MEFSKIFHPGISKHFPNIAAFSWHPCEIVRYYHSSCYRMGEQGEIICSRLWSKSVTEPRTEPGAQTLSLPELRTEPQSPDSPLTTRSWVFNLEVITWQKSGSHNHPAKQDRLDGTGVQSGCSVETVENHCMKPHSQFKPIKCIYTGQE